MGDENTDAVTIHDFSVAASKRPLEVVLGMNVEPTRLASLIYDYGRKRGWKPVSKKLANVSPREVYDLSSGRTEMVPAMSMEYTVRFDTGCSVIIKNDIKYLHNESRFEGVGDSRVDRFFISYGASNGHGPAQNSVNDIVDSLRDYLLEELVFKNLL